MILRKEMWGSERVRVRENKEIQRDKEIPYVFGSVVTRLKEKESGQGDID